MGSALQKLLVPASLGAKLKHFFKFRPKRTMHEARFFPKAVFLLLVVLCALRFSGCAEPMSNVTTYSYQSARQEGRLDIKPGETWSVGSGKYKVSCTGRDGYGRLQLTVYGPGGSVVMTVAKRHGAHLIINTPDGGLIDALVADKARTGVD